MAHQHLFFAFLLLFPACGGRETGDVPNSGTGGGGGGSVTGGTGGSSGTVGSAGVGGVSTAGQSGVGGQGQGGADWTSCTQMDSCLLEPAYPCGTGCEPVPLVLFQAISSAHLAEYKQSIAGGRCSVPQCFPVSPDQINTPNYFAACESGHCQPIDVRTSPLSACSDDSECTLRSGTTCCGCGSGNLIAVSKKANVEQAFCGPAGACAADCAVAPLPPGVVAGCSAGHCLVYYSRGDSGTH